MFRPCFVHVSSMFRPWFILALGIVCIWFSDSVNLDNITQRHGDDGVVSSKCSVGNGRVRDEGWGDRWGVGGLWGGGMCKIAKYSYQYSYQLPLVSAS